MKSAVAVFLLFFSSLSFAELLPASAPVVEAKAYVLFDYTSNQILVDRKGHDHIEPASLTKLMTAYITFGMLKTSRLSLSQLVTPSETALRTQGEESRMFLEHSKPVKIEDLLRGLIVQSGNDAARVLAETIASDELAFANQYMNVEAKRLGMNDTHFTNSTGLPDPQHYTSAYDLALLAAAIVRDFPEFYPIYSLHEFQYNNINQMNRNRLLWMDPYVDGMKTGHTETAGFCLVSSALRGKHRLISVVIGAASENMRASESQRLLNYGFQYYDSVQLYGKNQPVNQTRIWKGTEKTVPIGFRRDLAIAVPIGRAKELKASLVTQQPIIAPITAGQQIGVLRLTLAGKPYVDLPIVALESVPLANVFSRGIDTIRLLFQ
jgi:D-alanyl-D-alanine carboxypeptidase (penicillin-binding protein 5/6)